MSDFKKFATKVAARFEALSKHELYTVNVGRDQIFEAYLKAFPGGTDPIFRVRTTHDGSYDRAFIRNVGHVVAIIGDRIETLWDLEGLEYPYNIVAAELSKIVRNYSINNVFRISERFVGHNENVELIDGVTHKFSHFRVTVADRHFTATPDADTGKIRTGLGVFKRAMDEMGALTALDTITDLIASNSIYRGAEHKATVEGFRKLKVEYDASDNKEVFLWSKVVSGRKEAPVNALALFRNTSIGTLFVDLVDGVDTERAVRSFEAKVAPENYKRTTSVITPKMVEQAVAKLKELKLESAINRRYAKLSDISVNNVLFVNNDVKSMTKDGITDLLMSSVKTPKAFNRENESEVTIHDFLRSILPTAVSIGLVVDNNHGGNFVSLTAPADENTGRLFKWNNDFAWSYDGEVTDSIRERVKKAGGNVDAELRVSLAWHSASDLDLHAKSPMHSQIYYRNKCGVLDVDMNGLDKHDSVNPVENLSWKKAHDGSYSVDVNLYSQRGGTNHNFEMELYYKGETQTFAYEGNMRVGETIPALRFSLYNGKIDTLRFADKLKKTSGAIEKWNITGGQVIPVNLITTSPNFWDDQKIGNQHWFFILKDCINPEQTRGIYNEFLRGELEEHRKVFEVLGSKTKTPFSGEQLSGLGFSSTRKDEVSLVVTDRMGRVRTWRVKF